MANVDSLLERPHVRAMGEEDDFWRIYQPVVSEGQPRGNQVPDTFLAALLRQHGVATLFTRDRNLRRYDFLTLINPFDDEVREPCRSRYRPQAEMKAARRRAQRLRLSGFNRSQTPSNSHREGRDLRICDLAPMRADQKAKQAK